AGARIHHEPTRESLIGVEANVGVVERGIELVAVPAAKRERRALICSVRSVKPGTPLRNVRQKLADGRTGRSRRAGAAGKGERARVDIRHVTGDLEVANEEVV